MRRPLHRAHSDLSNRLAAHLAHGRVYASRWLPLPAGTVPVEVVVVVSDTVWLVASSAFQPARAHDSFWHSADCRCSPSPLANLEALRNAIPAIAREHWQLSPDSYRIEIAVVVPDSTNVENLYALPELQQKLAELDCEPRDGALAWSRLLPTLATPPAGLGRPCAVVPWTLNQPPMQYVVEQNDPSGQARRIRAFMPVDRTPREAIDYAYQRYNLAASHPNLVPVDLIADTHQVLEAWPHFNGWTLLALQETLPLTINEKLELASQLAKALTACHRHGIVHANVAPAHIDLNADVARLMHPWFEFCPFAAAGKEDRSPLLPSSDARALIALVRDLAAEDIDDRHELTVCLNAERPTMESLASAFDAELQRPEPSDWLPTEEPDHGLGPGTEIGDFRILRTLGGGGFSQVYEVVHELQSRFYALKVYHDNVPDADLIHEFNLLDQLHHPHIVGVTWSGRLPNGRPYLALDYLNGESLSHYAWGDQSLSIDQTLQMAEEMLSALHYLHAPAAKHGSLAGTCLYHRDIKPSNIMHVAGRGFVLIDFNVTRDSTEQDDFAGTQRYAPPDLLLGDVPWDASGDTYALGVTCYELLCGRPPYPEDHAGLDDEPLPPTSPGAPPFHEALAAFLVRAVANRRENRFATAAEMAASLADLRETLAAHSHPMAKVKS